MRFAVISILALLTSGCGQHNGVIIAKCHLDSLATIQPSDLRLLTKGNDYAVKFVSPFWGKLGYQSSFEPFEKIEVTSFDDMKVEGDLTTEHEWVSGKDGVLRDSATHRSYGFKYDRVLDKLNLNTLYDVGPKKMRFAGADFSCVRK